MNTITELLDLEDEDIIITDIRIQGSTKFLTLETQPAVHFCPCCGYRMHSRGIKKRSVRHPVLQDNYELVLLVNQRRWRCTNTACRFESNEEFHFLNPHRRITNATDMLIVSAFRDLRQSAAFIADKFGTSDTYVLDVFDRYVHLDRLPLTDIISVDEVNLNLDEQGKYALVIQDFYTGDPIDILPSRRSKVTEPYFSSIPKEERFAVRYLISDMYNPYIRYIDKYFPNAVSVVDSFHVIQWITTLIDNYMRQLLKKYRQKDKQREEQMSREKGRPVSIPSSKEVYLLQKFRWLILASVSNINYRYEPRMDYHLHQMMTTFDYEEALFRIDPNLHELRDLKELYIQFNKRNAGQPMDARLELDRLIHRYLTCDQQIFRDFANLLIRYHDQIINSFVMVEKHGPGGIYDSRLSNGPIESLNRKVKDLKRLGRGYRNFDHFRNRFLYATRNNPVLNGSSGSSYAAASTVNESDDSSYCAAAELQESEEAES